MADSRGNESTAGLFARLAETITPAGRGPWGQAQRLSKALGATFGGIDGPGPEDGFTIRFPDGSEATWRAEGRAWEETKAAMAGPGTADDTRRLDWLERTRTRVEIWPDRAGDVATLGWRLAVGFGYLGPVAATLRGAIDAAMGGQEGGEK